MPLLIPLVSRDSFLVQSSRNSAAAWLKGEKMVETNDGKTTVILDAADQEAIARKKALLGLSSTSRDEIDARLRPTDEDARWNWSYKADATPVRSALKGSRSKAAESGTTLNETLSSTKSGSRKVRFGAGLSEEPNWNDTRFVGRKSRATLANPKSKEAVRLQNQSKNAQAILKMSNNPLFSYVPTSNWTLEESNGTFDTLRKYGTKLSDAPTDPDARAKWDKEDKFRRESGYLTRDELGASVRESGSRSVASGTNTLGEWLTRLEWMAERNQKFLPKDKDERAEYLDLDSETETLPAEMEQLKGIMRSMQEKKDEMKARMAEERLERKAGEKLLVTTSDDTYRSLLSTATELLKEYHTDATSTDKDTAESARAKYMKKLRGRSSLLPAEAQMLYPEMSMGYDIHEVLDTLQRVSGKTDQEWNPKELSEQDRLTLTWWMTQNTASHKRAHPVVFAMHNDGIDVSTETAELFSTYLTKERPEGWGGASLGLSFEEDPILSKFAASLA